MKLSIIVAMTPDRVIGRDGGMPWHLPADLKRFRELTMGHPMIMGRRTFESLGRILPGRRHIVITRNPDFKCPDVDVARSLDDALSLAADSDEVFVIGGAQIFREALPRADRLYITQIDADIEGDTFFPEFDANAWREVAREERAADQNNTNNLTFLLFDRDRPPLREEASMPIRSNCPGATKSFDILNRYLGWGDRKGGIWFIGCEPADASGETYAEIRRAYKKLSEWRSTLPAKHWHRQRGGRTVREYTCKIVIPLSKIARKRGYDWETDWPKYRDLHLWRVGRQVCQANLLPLGRPNMNEQREFLKLLKSNGFDGFDAYIDCVRRTRFPRLREMLKYSNPQAVICFTMEHWDLFRELWLLKSQPTLLAEGDIEVYENERVILTPFFRGGNHMMSNTRSKLISDKLSRWGVSIY